MKFATKLAPIPWKLDLAQEAGFECAEFWIGETMLDDIEPILRAAAGRNMEYVLHFPTSGIFQERHLENAAHLHRELNCQAMVIHEPLMRSCGARLLAIDPGLRLCVENSLHSGDRLHAWARQNASLTLDVEHFWMFHLNDAPFADLVENLSSFLQLHAAKIGHVHLPGYVPGQGQHHPAHHHPELASAVFDLLLGHDYRHFIVSELDLPFQTASELRADQAFFRAWISSRAGVRGDA